MVFYKKNTNLPCSIAKKGCSFFPTVFTGLASLQRFAEGLDLPVAVLNGDNSVKSLGFQLSGLLEGSGSEEGQKWKQLCITSSLGSRF